MEAIKEILAWPADITIEILGGMFGPYTQSYAVSFFNWFDGYMHYIFGAFCYGILLFAGSEGIKAGGSKKSDGEIE